MSDDKLLSLELKISLLLRWGVLLAGAFMLIGWATLLDFSQNPLAAFHDYKGESLHDSLQNALTNNQWGLLMAYAGLLLLISLPLLRVLMTAVLFAKQKERVLAVIAFFVFATLIFSFSLGIEI
jgi:uncharacterized membrane protein